MTPSPAFRRRFFLLASVFNGCVAVFAAVVVATTHVTGVERAFQALLCVLTASSCALLLWLWRRVRPATQQPGSQHGGEHDKPAGQRG